MERVTPEQAHDLAAKNAARDRAEIKIQTIENGILVKIWNGWYTYPSWKIASEAIDFELQKRKAETTP